MRREKWTLLLLSEDGDDLLQRTFQIRTLRYAVGAGGLVCVGLLAATGLFGFLGGQTLRSAQLEHPNEVLTDELATIQAQVARLETDLGFLTDKDAELRVLAGLDQIDEEVLYREGLSASDLESAREELLEVLAFETGAPRRTFEREGAVFLLGATHPAARPLRGTPATVGSVATSDLEAFRSLYLCAEEGVLAANGPLQAEELFSVLSDAVRDLGEGGEV